MTGETSIKSTLPQPKDITREKALIVEGPDEEKFFNALFKNKDIDGIQIISTDGKDKFKPWMWLLKKVIWT